MSKCPFSVHTGIWQFIKFSFCSLHATNTVQVALPNSSAHCVHSLTYLQYKASPANSFSSWIEKSSNIHKYTTSKCVTLTHQQQLIHFHSFIITPIVAKTHIQSDTNRLTRQQCRDHDAQHFTISRSSWNCNSLTKSSVGLGIIHRLQICTKRRHETAQMQLSSLNSWYTVE